MNTVLEIYNIAFNHFLSFNYIERFNHSVRVGKMAIKLNEIHHLGLDNDLINICSLLHDMAKPYPIEVLQKFIIEKYGFDVELLQSPPIFHSLIGPEVIKKYFPNITLTKEMEDAIRYHTIGRPNMSNLEKLIFIADEVEEGREFKEAAIFREIAYKDLDSCIVAMIEDSIRYLKENNKKQYSGSLKTLEYYKGLKK